MKPNPTNKSNSEEKFKTFLRGKSGKFVKTERLSLKCRFCGSTNIVKFGYNITKGWKKQRYKCCDCNVKFTPTSNLIKPIKFTSNDKDIQNNKTKELQKLCKLIKKNIYPFLNFPLHYTAKYDTNTFLDLLTHVAMNHDFTENGSKTFRFVKKERTPSADVLLYHISKFKLEEVKFMFQKVFEKIFEIANKNKVFKKRRLDVAIDLHDWLYYGDKNDSMVVETKPKKGTTHCFRFATINIVESGKRFTLLALPMNVFDRKHKIVDELINYAKKKIKIGNVYVDRGFFSIKVIDVFKKHNLKFLMPAKKDRKIEQLVKNYDSPTIINYTLGGKYYIQGQTTFKLVIVNDENEIKRVFATNLHVNENNAHSLFGKYAKRWGIETSYRVKQDFKARTTSKRYVIRLFYFLFSACLYNLWILVNIIVGMLILKFIPKEPFIRAKMFGVILYTFIDHG
jgi:putative transposase